MENHYLSLTELQHLEFEILSSLHSFCEKNHLRYYLCGGTLIGAIRHKGFIPWDDDIDVMMPRDDYMKFIELTNGVLDDTKCLDSLYLNDNSFSAITRIYDVRTDVKFITDTRKKYKLGCWIDIYPIDGFPNSKIMRKVKCKIMRMLQVLQIARTTKIGVKRRSKLLTILQYGMIPLLPIIYIFKPITYFKFFEFLSKSKSYDKSTFVGVYDGRAGEKEVMKKADMEPAVLVEFWGQKFYAMANYDEYLTNLYGDYMTPPSIQEQVSRHEINVFWKTEK